MELALRAPLAYSLPAWHPGGYRDAQLWIDDLRSLGFRWITFTPTYLVYDEMPPRIDVSRGPSLTELRAAVEYAVACGMSVKLEPHLDFETTLTGGPYDWRARMRISPLGAYTDDVILPLLNLPCSALTLGSELDVSVCEFAADWERLAETVRGRGSTLGPALGHNLNPGAKRAPAREYIDSLDWVSVSFYQKISAARYIAPQLRRHAEQVARGLHGFTIGEFGLGSADLSRPWHCDAASLLVPGAMHVRRRYYLAFLEFLRGAVDLVGDRPSAFWTVDHCDFLGALRFPGSELFRDDELRQAVADYNLG